MAIESFYADLIALPDFGGIARPESYVPLPRDWHVLVSDVEGSTAAIREGRYKDVNLLGASSIIAVINAVKPVQVPFVFGGDGASICVPESVLPAARQALLATRALAAQEFDLKLRVGAVPVHTITDAGHRVLVAKVKLTETAAQAAFSGGGLQFAEQLIKDPHTASSYLWGESDGVARGDFTGLECRWNSIPSPRGEIVSLLVQATTGSPADDARVYREVIGEISRIYGGPELCRPVTESALTLGFGTQMMEGESKVRAGGRGRLARLLYRTRIQIETAIGVFLMAIRGRIAGVHWGRYKKDVIANTDFRKFDDRLRQILSGDAAQRRQLEAYLEGATRSGELAYGLHVASTAMMTCLIFDRSSNQHMHFVDGSDGGYAAAAEELKRRLKSVASASMNRRG